jgi:endonuclease/exonuclease/phosphatase (EEP) superfamily protein YafD
MKRAHAVLVALLGVAATAGPGCAAKAVNYADPLGPRYDGRDGVAPVSAPRVLRIVTFNIEYGKRVEEAIAALRTRPELRWPDLLFLQEMDAPGVATIARALALNSAYFPVSQDSETKHDFGNAILSPWPIEEAWKVPLPHLSRVVGRARAGVGARIVIGSRSLRAYSVHLGAPLGTTGGERREQARILTEKALETPGPIVVAGDFNSRDVGGVLVERGFRWITESLGPTVKLGPFSMRFDHVFAWGLRPTDGGVAAGVAREVNDASDHFPVWALLEWDSGTSAGAPGSPSGVPARSPDR